MSQAHRSLSAVQRDSLELAVTCFKGITPFLESVENKFTSDERLQSMLLRSLVHVCEKKLFEAFPDLHEWLAEWTRGGGQ